jgi:hypothetical protein
MFLSIVDIYKHLWPIQSLQLLLHISVQVRYFVQPDLDELSAGITGKDLKNSYLYAYTTLPTMIGCYLLDWNDSVEI